MESILTINHVPILQTAIGPVILISGIGLLLLTMTNRLGRTIDRARILVADKDVGQEQIQQQIQIFWQRARTLQLAILLSSMSALCAALLVILLFLTVLLKIELGWLISGLFCAGMVTLIGSLFFFIRDVNMTLEALQLELHISKKENS